MIHNILFWYIRFVLVQLFYFYFKVSLCDIDYIPKDLAYVIYIIVVIYISDVNLTWNCFSM